MNKKKVMQFVQKYTMVLVLVLVSLFFAVQTNGKILLPQNINNLFAQNAYVFVLATGMLLCILTGGNIDLSVGSVVCFIGAVMMSKGANMWVAVLAMLVIGLAIGAWQAFWIAYVKVPPFITTLAGMLVFRGLSNVVLQGKTLAVKDATFVRLFGGGADCYVPDAVVTVFEKKMHTFPLIVAAIAVVLVVALTFLNRQNRVKKGYEVESLISSVIKTVVIVALIAYFSYKLSLHKGLPTALIWVALIIGIYSYITSKTTVGRHFYAVGGNELATKLSGINTNKIYFIAYANMGLLAAFAGLLTIARLTSAQPTYGQNYEMDAIGSCFIGGASAYGGIGTVPGVIIGAILMGVINIGMSIMGVDANWQKVVKGLVLLAAVIFDVVSKRKQN